MIVSDSDGELPAFALDNLVDVHAEEGSRRGGTTSGGLTSSS